MSGLNGWIVCRFHGARGGAPEGTEWQLPARLQDEGNDRGLEAHKITALTFAWGPIGQTPDFYPRNAHCPLLLRVEVTPVKGSSLRTANLSLNPISPIANPCCNRAGGSVVLSRRDFIKAIADQPLAARAQQREQMRRIGVLMEWRGATVKLGAMILGFPNWVTNLRTEEENAMTTKVGANLG
jgi:hypothetical protein